MSEDWASTAEDVAAGIAEAGFAVTLTKPGTPTGPDYDPTPGTPVSSTIYVVDDKIRTVNASGVPVYTRTLLVATGGAVPARGDSVVLDGATFQLAEVRRVSPAGVTLMYEADLAV